MPDSHRCHTILTEIYGAGKDRGMEDRCYKDRYSSVTSAGIVGSNMSSPHAISGARRAELRSYMTLRSTKLDYTNTIDPPEFELCTSQR